MLEEIFASPKEWQSLIAGLLAIGAALIGGAFIWAQIRSGRKIERQRRSSKFDAAKATLPLLLSELIEWTDATIASVKSLYAKAENNLIPKEERGLDWSELNAAMIPELRTLIEFSDDRKFRKYVGAIVQDIQVIRARLDSWSPDKPGNLIVVEQTLTNRIVDLLILRARIESLFPFARLQDKRPPITPMWDRAFSYVMLLHLDEVDLRSFEDAVHDRIEQIPNERSIIGMLSSKLKIRFVASRPDGPA